MSKCKHDMEYGQEADDFQKDHWQMRCTKCGYKSYMLSRPALKDKNGDSDG